MSHHFLIFICINSYNQAKPKTELEKKIYEVLSHKNWGSSSTLLNEIAENTYDFDKCKCCLISNKMRYEPNYLLENEKELNLSSNYCLHLTLLKSLL